MSVREIDVGRNDKLENGGSLDQQCENRPASRASNIPPLIWLARMASHITCVLTYHRVGIEHHLAFNRAHCTQVRDDVGWKRQSVASHVAACSI